MLAMAASEVAILLRDSSEKAGLPGWMPTAAFKSTEAGWGEESIELWLLSEGCGLCKRREVLVTSQLWRPLRDLTPTGFEFEEKAKIFTFQLTRLENISAIYFQNNFVVRNF